MHAFDILGDPVRRRIIELVSAGELSAGEITTTVMGEFGITQPAVSRHLRILRESGFLTMRPAGTRRIYALQPESLAPAKDWIDGFWNPALDALQTEIKRQNRAARTETDAAHGAARTNRQKRSSS